MPIAGDRRCRPPSSGVGPQLRTGDVMDMGAGTAVIVGGSLAGMLAAQALGDAMERVVIVERDALADGPAHRRGAPQGRQTHMLLPIGARALEDLLPGFERELRDAGCLPFDRLGDMAIFGSFGWLARASSDVVVPGVDRVLIEHLVRRHVRALPNVEIRQAAAEGLLGTPGDDRVRGVRLAGGEELEADLVIDAAGRGSRVGRWVKELGYPQPAEHHSYAYFGYVSRLVHVPDGVLPDGLQALGVPPVPGHTRGGLIVPAGAGRHWVLALGSFKDYAPTDDEGFLAYLHGARSPLLGQVVERSEPLEAVASFHIPGSWRQRWDQLERRPGRLLAVGDAVATLNPIYAQGMSLAAIEAQRLRDRIAAVDGDLDALSTQFMDDVTEVLEVPWAMATGADTGIGATDLVGVEPPPDSVVEFGRRAQGAATVDVHVARQMMRALAWFDRSRMGAPEVVSRVGAYDESRRPAAVTDPTRVPALVDEPEVGEEAQRSAA
jgi:2-polyprenyl-6-methoxyphenol hydroxylase-like FAD-dependent oxidoreductase